MAVQSPPATALYCYGITTAKAVKAQPGAGLGAAPVEAVICGELAALTSGVPAGTVRARRRDLVTHFDVVGKALERGTVLPLRFGIIFDDEHALTEECLRPRHDELARMLHEFGGQVELRVIAHYREE